MAVGNFSPSGFSYAQAARGTSAASQTPSSKVTSGAATPATSIALDASNGGNWADDMEENEGTKVKELQEVESVEAKAAPPKDSAIDRTKAEEKLVNGVSGGSSPDMTSSSTASIATRDDSPSAPVGSSSDITSETKSQASEPAWIMERKERQNGSQGSDAAMKSERKSKKSASIPKEELKPVVLTEALPPTVNPWQKRAEEAKVKVTSAPPPAPQTTTTTTPLKENQPPSTNGRRGSNTASAARREQVAAGSEVEIKPNAANGKRPSEVRISNRQSSKPTSTEVRSGSGATRSGAPQSRSLQNLASGLPSVKDEDLWPTPETAQNSERRESPEKESDDKRDDDGTSSSKKRKEWKIIPVTPNVIWETQSMNEPRERKPRAAGSERGGRGGGRGRGNIRGGASAVNGGDRTAGRSSPSTTIADGEQASEGTTRANERDSAPTPAKQLSNTPADHAGSLSDAATQPEQVASRKAPRQADETSVSAETRRTRSPKKSVPTQTGATDEIPTPAPIPRKTPTSAQATNDADRTPRDTPVRLVATENRKESRNGDVFRDANWSGPPRGGKRGGRGRGGNGAAARDFNNSHSFGASLQNEYGGHSPYGVPPSPSGYSRGNHHQFSYPPSGSARGVWSRGGGPRSHSIPIEGYYPRFASQQYGGGPGHVPNMHAYMPSMSEYGPMPSMSAIMPSPQEAQDHLLVMVTAQLEYYFGVENLIRDIFLRKHMDSQGFVFLDFIAGFNRIKQLTSDSDLVKTACLNSQTIEIRIGEDGKERLRKREGWEQFVRPVEERDQSAQTEGPQLLQRPDRPQLSMPNGSSPFQGPYSAGLPAAFQRGPYDARMMNGFAPQFVPNGDYNGLSSDFANGEETRGRSAKSPIYENGVGPADQPFTSTEDEATFEPDAFPDEQMSALGIVVRMSEQPPPYHNAASRTFSNGSIDTRSIASELDKAAESESKPQPNGVPATNDADKLPSLSRHLSPNKARSPEQGPPNVEREVCWSKDLNKIPAGTTYESYTQLRLKALDQRNHAATGTCPYDLDILYQFWCHFLCRNFNNRMYTEFRYYAQTDARERHSLTGIKNLLKFYQHSLSSPDAIRERVARDYVGLAKNPPSALEASAFKQLRSQWRDGALNLKNRKKMGDMMDEQLKTALDKSKA